MPEPRRLLLCLAKAIFCWTPFSGNGADGQSQPAKWGNRDRNAGALEELDSGNRWFLELYIGCHDAPVAKAHNQSRAIRLLGA